MKTPIVFKKSLPSESQLLSDIAINAKGYWGYSQEQLDLWRKDLRIEASYITENHVRSIWRGNQTVGFFAIVKGDPDRLDHLWISPESIGKGYGKQAIDEIQKISRQLSIRQLTIISDPDAEGFYLHHGAIRIGEQESIPQNRMLPKLRLVTDSISEE